MNNVMIIGDIMLDINYIGNANRIAQEACIPVVNVKNENIIYSLGGAANVCHNLYQMGVNVSMIYLESNDYYASIMNDKINSCTINNYKIKTKRCTTVKHRFYVNNKIVFRYDSEETQNITEDEEISIIETFEKAIENCNILILSDYNKGLLTPSLTRYLIEIAKKNNIKVFVDPKIKNIEK